MQLFIKDFGLATISNSMNSYQPSLGGVAENIIVFTKGNVTVTHNKKEYNILGVANPRNSRLFVKVDTIKFKGDFINWLNNMYFDNIYPTRKVFTALTDDKETPLIFIYCTKDSWRTRIPTFDKFNDLIEIVEMDAFLFPIHTVFNKELDYLELMVMLNANYKKGNKATSVHVLQQDGNMFIQRLPPLSQPLIDKAFMETPLKEDK